MIKEQKLVIEHLSCSTWFVSEWLAELMMFSITWKSMNDWLEQQTTSMNEGKTSLFCQLGMDAKRFSLSKWLFDLLFYEHVDWLIYWFIYDFNQFSIDKTEAIPIRSNHLIEMQFDKSKISRLRFDRVLFLLLKERINVCLVSLRIIFSSQFSW